MAASSLSRHNPAIVAFRKVILARLGQFTIRDTTKESMDRFRDVTEESPLWSASIYDPVMEIGVASVRITTHKKFGLRASVYLNNAAQSLSESDGRNQVAWNRGPVHRGRQRKLRIVFDRRVKIRRLAAAWAHRIREHVANLHSESVHSL
jgi:hypothetical protein